MMKSQETTILDPTRIEIILAEETKKNTVVETTIATAIVITIEITEDMTTITKNGKTEKMTKKEMRNTLKK